MRSSHSRPLAVCCLAATLLTGFDAPEEPVRLEVRGTFLVPTLRSLAAVCPTALRIHACTTFTNETLSTQCIQSGDVWFLGASANVDADVYLWNPRQIRHEHLHIEDIRGWLDEYLASINRIRFESREKCETFGEHSRQSFPAQLNAMKLRSNDKRDRRSQQPLIRTPATSP